MVSETYKNSQDQALEERLSNMHEQMAGVTSRLDQTERALDLERATREDIIKAEVYPNFGIMRPNVKSVRWRWARRLISSVRRMKPVSMRL